MKLPTPEERPWLTITELAEITGEGQKAIRAAIAAGDLPSLRVGRYIRIPTTKLRQVLGIDAEGTGPDELDATREVVPESVALPLLRALTWCGDRITEVERNRAWAWVDSRRDDIEEMGQ